MTSVVDLDDVGAAAMYAHGVVRAYDLATWRWEWFLSDPDVKAAVIRSACEQMLPPERITSSLELYVWLNVYNAQEAAFWDWIDAYLKAMDAEVWA